MVPGLLLLLAIAAQVTPNTLSSLERQAGWELLFDGRSLAGWHAFGRQSTPQTEGGWEVTDGCLHLRAGRRGGDLATDRDFGDFELELEWRVAPGANSGIKYRVLETAGASAMLGPEYQVLDDERHPDGGKGTTSAASLYALYAPQGKTLEPAGGFNHTRIVARGDRIEHWLNGVRVLECTAGSADWEERRKASKFAPYADFGRGRGSIGLQDHGDEVWFRSIRVRDLERRPGRAVELFDGRTLDGWKVHGDARYSVDDGCILGETGGGGHSFLVSEQNFGDFLFEVELKPERAGNSGIQIRSHVNETGRVYGYQVEIDSSSRAWSGGLYDEGRRGWLDDLSDNQAARAAFRPGEWNHYRIECLGPWIRTWVNGVPAADFLDPLDLQGFIGLQVHGGQDTRVRWRNLRLRDLGTQRWERLEPEEFSDVWSTRDLRMETYGGSDNNAIRCDLALEQGVLGYRLTLESVPRLRFSADPLLPYLMLDPDPQGAVYGLAAALSAEPTGELEIEVLIHCGRATLTSRGRALPSSAPGPGERRPERLLLFHGGDLALESLERLGPPGQR